jgi:hypothetical protein
MTQIPLTIDLANCSEHELQLIADRLPMAKKVPGVVWEFRPRIARPSMFKRYLEDQQNGAAAGAGTEPPEGPAVQ